MARTILAHLNVEVPDGYAFTADQVAAEILGALEVGTDAGADARARRRDRGLHPARRGDLAMADSIPHELVGRTFRSPEGGTPMTVVAVDDRFVHVKRVDASRRQLANPAGAHIVRPRSEFQDWKDLSPDADPDYGDGDTATEEDEAFRQKIEAQDAA